MALQAKVRHGCVNQLSCDRTVWGMAVRAIFCNVAMLEDEGAAFFHVATGAHIPDGCPFEHFGLSGAMRIVAVEAVHLLLPYRVVGKKTELGFYVRVALVA